MLRTELENPPVAAILLGIRSHGRMPFFSCFALRAYLRLCDNAQHAAEFFLLGRGEPGGCRFVDTLNLLTGLRHGLF